MSDTTLRAFIAIELPDDIKTHLHTVIQNLRQRVAGPDIKWVAPESIHLTLKFLGHVPTSRVEEFQQSLGDICTATPPMWLAIQALGGFPSTRTPRVIWAGLGGDIEPLALLAERIDVAFTELGFPKETRAFTPHLTIARIRQEATRETRTALGAALAEAHIARGIEFRAVAVSLMRSQLLRSGAVYSRLASHSFDSSSKPD